MIDQYVAEENEGIVPLCAHDGVYNIDVLMDKPGASSSTGAATLDICPWTSGAADPHWQAAVPWEQRAPRGRRARRRQDRP